MPDDKPKLRLVLATSSGRNLASVGTLRVPPATIATVEVMARFALAARRAGITIRVEEVTPELEQLLELVGLLEPDGPFRRLVDELASPPR